LPRSDRELRNQRRPFRARPERNQRRCRWSDSAFKPTVCNADLEKSNPAKVSHMRKLPLTSTGIPALI
jgi:hypothetical protein